MIPIEKILKYLSNSSSIAEDIAVDQWLESNKDNLRELEIYENILLHTQDLSKFKSFDVNAEWQSFLAINNIDHINTTETSGHSSPLIKGESNSVKEAKVIPLDSIIATSITHTQTPSPKVNPNKKEAIEASIPVPTKRKSKILPISVAASLLLLVCSYFMLNKPDPVIETPAIVYKTISTQDQPQIVTLEDGTTVELGINTEFTFPESFAGIEERNVTLEGAGLFKVTENTESPMIIEAGKTEVKVLGTTFKVSMDSEEDIEVENIEGLIKFYEAGNEENGHLLTQGQKMTRSEEGFTDITEKEEIPYIPLKGHTISKILNQLNLVSDGRISTSTDLRYNKRQRFEVNLNQDYKSILAELFGVAEVNWIPVDCEKGECYKITKFSAIQ